MIEIKIEFFRSYEDFIKLEMNNNVIRVLIEISFLT